jgi:hypothetical protein
MIKLYEIDHPYYCTEHNYRVSGNQTRTVVFQYDNWEAFTESGWFNSDLDLNLLFRFDWRDQLNEDGTDTQNGQLCLFWMRQRKGDFNSCIISNMKIENEFEVREWLQNRFDHLKKIWEPLT